MNYPNIELIDITYHEFETVLKELKFKNISDEKRFRMYNEEYDADVILPVGKKDDLIPKAYYQGITFILFWKDVIEKRSGINERVYALRDKWAQTA